MPITATVSRAYSIRMIALGVLCLVFGVWGLYDYFVGIPARQAAADRFRMLDLVRDVLQMPPTDEAYDQTLADAQAAVQGELDQLVQRNVSQGAAAADLTPEQVQELVDSLQQNEQEQLMIAALAIFQEALNQQRSASGVLSDEQMLANRIAADTIGGMESVTAPSGFDRAFQWVYILCLPFAPYFLWKWWSKHRRRYVLEDDGTLRMPEDVVWSDEDITDIDMNRWMDKSLAYVVHRDGSRVELDDYFYQNMHLIVGRFAHRFHPEQWHEDARQKRDEVEAEESEPAV